MPVGKLTRKSSNETLDSTLDSRMSSADIPKMELLKINYVHQCKEALMPRSSELPLPPRLPQRISSSTINLFSYEKSHLTENTRSGHVTKVMLGDGKLKKMSASQVLPPPTVESWNFLQSTDTNSAPSTPTTPKCLVQPRPLEDSDNDNEQTDIVSCNSACSSNESDNNSSTDTLITPHAEVSKSWDYRTHISTRDLRREMARVGVKSRADRIAHIERTECYHLKRAADNTAPNKTDVVSRINQLFENTAAKPQTKDTRPPQPMRPAPLSIKEPNMRRRPFSQAEQQQNSNNCSCAFSDVESVKGRTASLDNRNRNSAPVTGKLFSRIPKPINDRYKLAKNVNQKSNEQLQQRIKQIFEQSSAQNRKIILQTAKSIDGLTNSEQNERESEHLSDIDHKLLRNACQSYGSDHHKMKVERIHIRKKRQPLLIINQLNGDETKNRNDEPNKSVDVQTCGYKNCNIANCPISAHKHTPVLDAEDILKRLSLESGSDSGVSSSHDSQEQIKENNLKNLEKCSDCVKILENEHTACYESEHTKNVDKKLKEIEHTDGKQIKIHVRKPQVDPNDVQYFSNKNLTKLTTDEILYTAANTKTKKCNIENDIKNIEQRKFNEHVQKTTKIHIDDDWVQEPTDTLNEFLDKNLLKTTLAAARPQRKPINCSDNAVKIFVRSSATTAANDVDSSRASSVSAMSYASQTSGFSSASSVSSASTKSIASSMCECNKNCCQPTEGLFINQHLQVPEIPPRRRPKDVRFAPQPPTSPSLSSVSTSSSFASTNPTNVGGVFWNNNCFCTESALNENNDSNQCCCECTSSCEEDNCSYYEIECAATSIPKTPPLLPRKSDIHSYTDEHCMDKKQQTKKVHSSQLNDSMEEFLICNSKLLRKVRKGFNYR